jgi:hypothetical protein
MLVSNVVGIMHGHIPQRTSPPMSWTLHFHYSRLDMSQMCWRWRRTRPGGSLESSSQNFVFKILPAMDSMSFSVSSLETAARTSRPLPMEDISWPSTVTEADLTRCIIAVPD